MTRCTWPPAAPPTGSPSRNRTRSRPQLGLLDADALLRQVYEAARTISYASDVTWREVGRVLRARAVPAAAARLLGGGAARAGRPERSPLAEGVVEQDGEVVLARAARPERDPVLPLRAAAAAAQAGLPLSLHAVRRLAAAARPLPVPWPRRGPGGTRHPAGRGRAHRRRSGRRWRPRA